MKKINRVNFPQPEVVSPACGQLYFFAPYGRVASDTWGSLNTPQGFDSELKMLARGQIYLTIEETDQRIAWNAQQMARLVIPTWFRALGPDVECKVGKDWLTFTRRNAKNWVENWSQEKPESYRAKPKPAPDVVVNVNGVEYRWPATVGTSDPQIDKYLVCIVGSSALITCERNAPHTGNRTHYTHAGAEAQAAMFNATLGVP